VPQRRVALLTMGVAALLVVTLGQSSAPGATAATSLVAAGAGAAGASAAGAPATAPRRHHFDKGIAFAAYDTGDYESIAARRSLENLRSYGANCVEIIVTGYQDTVLSTSIDRLSSSTPSDAGLAVAIHRAHALGMRVFLKPHIGLRDDSHPTGQIGIFFTAVQWTTWFANYDRFIVHYARIAQAQHVELFCVGNELDVTTLHPAQWRRVIAHVRAVYSGPITYADARLVSQPKRITFWNKLDYIGANCYPSLSTAARPTVAQFRAGWVRYLPKLRPLAVRWQRPILLTEIGVRSVSGGWIYPWDCERSGTVDLTMQTCWYQAALEVVPTQQWIAGLYWWQWSTETSVGGPHDTGYTPWHKPAGTTLRSWYGWRLRTLH
jgi:hypothetical protein